METNNIDLASKGALVISLDFELLWGIFDKVDYKKKEQYFQNTKNVIPKILTLFEEYGINATWATVGMLFNKNWEEWENNFPDTLPKYDNNNLNPFEYGKSIYASETATLCFSSDLIQLIKATSGQELATHTYSHYYCNEKGQTIEMFEADLRKAIDLGKRYNVTIKSLVFPRNQFNKYYLKVCEELGILNIRVNPDSWYWKDPEKNSISQKIFRTGDAYFGLNDKSYPLNSIFKDGSKVTLQKASRMFRPFSNKKVFEQLKISRIKSEITKAARNSEIYHLWWHPHNFGNHPDEALIQLIEILDHFQYCKNKFGFTSQTMEGLRVQLEKRT